MNKQTFSGASWRHLSIVVVALLLVIGFLYCRVHIRQKQVGKQTARSIKQINAQSGPMVGSKISLLSGRDISHRTETIDVSHRKMGTVLLVLSPVCPYCRVNFHNWRDLLRGVSQNRVIWVDLTGTADSRYMATVGIPSKANLILLNEDDAQHNRLVATPTTVLLDPHGLVVWSSSGIISSLQVNQIRGFLVSSHVRPPHLKGERSTKTSDSMRRPPRQDLELRVHG
jgi:hypothetical protein